MLQFLNNQQNKKDHPNENFGREVMELFTMGRGNYTEKDVKDFWKEYIGNIKPFYLEQKKDDDVIISASPEFLLKPVCKRLKIKNLMASKVDMHSGKYSGVNCHGKEKVKRFYEAFPDGKIDNFYSDSYSDSPLAEIAEKAFMVDGDKVEGWIFFK